MATLTKHISLFALAISFLVSCSTIYPITATNHPIGPKVGRSSTAIFFGTSNPKLLSSGIVVNNNFGVMDAIKNGQIDSVSTVDLKVTNFVVFQRAEIIIYGN